MLTFAHFFEIWNQTSKYRFTIISPFYNEGEMSKKKMQKSLDELDLWNFQRAFHLRFVCK